MRKLTAGVALALVVLTAVPARAGRTESEDFGRLHVSASMILRAPAPSQYEWIWSPRQEPEPNRPLERRLDGHLVSRGKRGAEEFTLRLRPQRRFYKRVTVLTTTDSSGNPDVDIRRCRE